MISPPAQTAPTGHTTLLRRWINVNDVDSHINTDVYLDLFPWESSSIHWSRSIFLLIASQVFVHVYVIFNRIRGGSRKKSDRVPTSNHYHYEYIYGNFRVLNIREFLILGLFVKSTILNINKKSAAFRLNWYSHWVVECYLSMGLVVFFLPFTAE